MTQLAEGAIEAVATLARQAATTQREKIGAYEFADRPLVRVDVEAKRPTPLKFYTLGGFVRYVAAEPEAKGALIHVVHQKEVQAIGRLEGQDKHVRRVFAVAEYLEPAIEFEFANYEPLEDLNIALQVAFVQSVGQIGDLRAFCSQIRASGEVGTADDGVSQTVSAKRGIAAVMSTKVNNPWALALHRTFAEVEQPVSWYVLRFRSGGESSLPAAALFETADGGWRVRAVETIAKYLRVSLPENEVLG